MDRKKLEQHIEAFKQGLPNFVSFENPGSEFAKDELDYKREFSDKFKVIADELIRSEKPDRHEHFLKEFDVLLNKKMPKTGEKQNLVNWRDWDEFAKLVMASSERQKEAVLLIAGLLQAAEAQQGVAGAIDDLCEWFNGHGATPGVTKRWISLLLFLWRPEDAIFVKPDFFDRSLKSFGFEPIGSQPLSSRVYSRVIDDMAMLKEGLSSLKPHDYIDVQSFMWEIDNLVNAPNTSSTVRVWLMQIAPDRIRDSDKPIHFDIADQSAGDPTNDKRLAELQNDDLALVLDPGNPTQVRWEARIASAEIGNDAIEVALDSLSAQEVDISVDPPSQAITAGLFTQIRPDNDAASVCREFLDKTRPAYLLTWNPEKFSKGGAGTDKGLLGYVPGDQIRWSCHTTKVVPGDPVYILRLGSNSARGLVAKARICSEPMMDKHWDPKKPDKKIRYVQIEFEDVRDGPDEPSISIDTLNDRFPDQKWSPQASGIEIKPRYRTQVHKMWEQQQEVNPIARLFEAYKTSERARNWLPDYREAISEVEKARSTGQIHDELVERIWLKKNNGISSAGQGQLPKASYRNNIEELRVLTEQIIKDPTMETFELVKLEWQRLRDEGKVSWIPRLLIRRAFAAANPGLLATIVSSSDMKKLGILLADRHQKVFDNSDHWFEQNRKLKAFLKGKQVDESDLSMLNTFCWHLYVHLKEQDETETDPTPDRKTRHSTNVILYGPPGTGKTYSLKEVYFPRYTSEDETVSQREWVDSIIDNFKWCEVVAAALYDLGGGPAKVKELLDHRFIRAKARLQARESVSSSVWGNLRNHASPECAVNTTRRREPFWFWKDEGSLWRFSEDWEETGGEVIDAVKRINKGPKNGKSVRRYEFVTFHQSYSYEEFVEGIRPALGDGGDGQGEISYILSKGVFRRLCDKARQDPGHRYALFIDEINRGNISKILGELITLIEPDKREGARNEMSATLPYSGVRFSVPQNVDLIGTMNTADRSLAHIDTALRRRFEFQELMPKPQLLQPVMMDGVEINISQMLETMNERIEAIFDREHMIGHAYFIAQDGKTVAGSDLPNIFKNKVIPLLTEYFFEDWSKVRAVLADDQQQENTEIQFVRASEVNSALLPAKSVSRNRQIYRLNKSALSNPLAYIKIYESAEDDSD